MKKSILFASAFIATFLVAAAWAENAKEGAPAQNHATEKTKEEPLAQGPAVPLEIEGVHNAFKLGRSIYSGSCPSGELGFKSLAAKGVKTVISVDGARPDEAAVKKYGMRYVHIPVTYSGITRAQALSIARAVRDLPGPVFIHCHHGKHRGPTAAVLAVMVSEGWTSEEAQAAMTQAGTAPTYTGLWANARDWKPPTKEELDQADATFPSSAKIEATAAAMVSIDERWEHLSEVRAADWGVPAAHPDIDPPHEALLLREHFTELLRLPETDKYPADYREKMTQAQAAALVLEQAIREKDKGKAQKAFKDVGLTCGSCHATYRNVKPTVAATR